MKFSQRENCIIKSWKFDKEREETLLPRTFRTASLRWSNLACPTVTVVFETKLHLRRESQAETEFV